MRPLAYLFVLFVFLAACARPGAGPPPPDGGPPARARAADTVELVLLGTTDVHGYVYPYDYYRGRETDYGLARLKPVVDSIRGANPGRTYLFDSGDLLQGNPLAFVYARQRRDEPNPVIRAMNHMGYAASAIGNHEFNYGLDHLDRAIETARFPFVSANIFEHGTDRHAYRPYALLPHPTPAGDTILLGVTGATPPGVHVWDRDKVEGVLEFRDVVASVRPVVRELRRRGADLVVVLSHGGLEGTSYDRDATGLPEENAAARMAREVPGIDVIFLGHTHRERADTTINGVLLTQAKNWAASLAVATVKLRRTGPGAWRVAAKNGRIVRPDPTRADTAFLDSLRWPHERAVAYVNSVVGRAAERMEARAARVRDTPILDFINAVQRRATGADLSAASAFTLDAALPEGEVTVADLAGLYIYDNTLKAVRITGAQLKAYLEKSAEYYHRWTGPGTGPVTNPDIPGYNFDVVSGVDYVMDLSRPVGQRITELRYRGEAVRPDQTFTLALNNYRQSGGGGYSMLADLPVVYDRQEDIRQLLIEEVRRKGVIRPEDYFRENWRIVPREAAEAALEEHNRDTRPTAAETRAERTRLRVVATNDFHGRLLPRAYGWTGGREVGGAAALAGYFRAEARGFTGPTLILDGGDVLQGTPLSNLTDGRATVAYYNTVGYHAAAIGNHEFDWGTAVLRDRIGQSDFPWLAANITVAGTDTLPSWVRPTALLEVQGVTVGVIGLATEATPYVTKARNVAGLAFTDLAAAVDRWVPVLRSRGADFVVVVAHAGAICDAGGECTGEIIDMARRVRHRPDLVVGGHTHRVVNTRVNGIPIVEAGAYGTRYAVVDLERGPVGRRAWVRGLPVTYVDRVRPDSAVQALVARYQEEIGPRVNQVVATLAEALERSGSEHALGRLIADAQRWATRAQVAVMNNGGIRAELDAGAVTWADLYRVQPFENRLIRLQMTGRQLRVMLEDGLDGDRPSIHVSGISVWYDPDRPAGERIITLELEDGTPVRDDGIYSVTMNDFMAGPADAPKVHALSREDTGIVDLDGLIEYLQALPSPAAAPAAPRLHPVEAGATRPVGQEF